MKELLQNLSKLQSIELAKTEGADAAIAELRAKIPAQILGHYDRLMARGKKGIVPVRNQICTGCHMRVPLGAIMTLRHGEDVQICDCCGRYLFLPPETEPVETKPKRRSRKSAETRSQPVAVAH